MNKIKKILIPLLLGVSLSFGATVAVSGPGLKECRKLLAACEQGNDYACEVWNRYCYPE